jgi:hypothetical protein
MVDALKNHCFRALWKQCGNNENRNHRKPLRNGPEQRGNNAETALGNKETTPLGEPFRFPFPFWHPRARIPTIPLRCLGLGKRTAGALL